jgi:hypothetical protein
VHDLPGHVEGLRLGIEGKGHTLRGSQPRSQWPIFHHVRLHMGDLHVGQRRHIGVAELSRWRFELFNWLAWLKLKPFHR